MYKLIWAVIGPNKVNQWSGAKMSRLIAHKCLFTDNIDNIVVGTKMSRQGINLSAVLIFAP